LPIVGTPIRLTNNSDLDAKPSLAWDGTHFGVAYVETVSSSSTSTNHIHFALLNPDGTLVSDVDLSNAIGDAVSANGFTTEGPHLVWSGSEYALVWPKYNAANMLMFIRLDATGTPKGTPITIFDSSLTSSPTPQVFQVAWSGADQQYALAVGDRAKTAFARLGSDASKVEMFNSFSLAGMVLSGNSLELGAAPDGAWGISCLASTDSVSFAPLNPDGSRTLAPAHLSSDISISGRSPSMTHDGTAWLTAWIGASTRDILVNRGSVANSPVRIYTGVSPVAFGAVNVTMAGKSLAVGWLEQTTSSTREYRYRVQRFSIPTTATSPLVALHSVTDVLTTYNISETNDVALAASGPNGLLAVWSDTRWGTARELYSAPLDLQNCQ
jgi:hypothetical protein